MNTCTCIDEQTEDCAYGEHNKCDESTIPHMCMCFCHVNMVGDKFVINELSWIRTGPKTVKRIQ